MTTTYTFYNHTAKLIAGQELDLANLVVLLGNASATFDATDTSLDDVLGAISGGHRPNEVHGNGWTETGEVVANVAASIVTTNDAKIDGDPVVVTATGGSIDAYVAILADGTSLKPLGHIDFGALKSAGTATDFRIDWHTSGMIPLTNPA